MIQETSQQAYFTEVLPTLAERHQEVLKVLATVPDATNMELKEMLKWEINRVTPRVHELVHPKDPEEKPLIEEVGRRKCKITGRTAIAWRVVRKQATKDPTIRRCFKCPHTAVTYLEGKPVCQGHSVKEPVAPSLF